jgi:hypothetical protein
VSRCFSTVEALLSLGFPRTTTSAFGVGPTLFSERRAGFDLRDYFLDVLSISYLDKVGITTLIYHSEIHASWFFLSLSLEESNHPDKSGQASSQKVLTPDPSPKEREKLVPPNFCIPPSTAHYCAPTLYPFVTLSLAKSLCVPGRTNNVLQAPPDSRTPTLMSCRSEAETSFIEF